MRLCEGEIDMSQRKTEATTLEAWWFATGNIANNLIFMLITMFMMFYFTNVMGLDPVVAGTIFMVARLVDALTDPIMGMIVDRTNSKRFILGHRCLESLLSPCLHFRISA